MTDAITENSTENRKKIQKRPRRRLFQFTLRHMVVNVTLLVALAGVWVLPSLKQYEAAVSIKKAGGNFSFINFDLTKQSANSPSKYDNDAPIYAHFFRRVKFVQLPVTSGKLPLISWIDLRGLENLTIQATEASAFNSFSREQLDFDDYLTTISPLQSSKKLTLENVSLSARSVKAISELKNTEELTVDGANYCEELHGLQKLLHLKSIVVSCKEPINISELAMIPSLENIEIKGNVGALALDRVPEQSSLKVLAIYRFTSRASWKILKKLPNLEEFYSGDFANIEVDSESLGSLKNLKRLRISNQFTDIGMATIAQLPSLEEMLLVTESITNESFLKLANCPRLTSLTILDRNDPPSKISAQTLDQFLRSSSRLTKLKLDWCLNITEAELHDLRVRYPNVKINPKE